MHLITQKHNPQIWNSVSNIEHWIWIDNILRIYPMSRTPLIYDTISLLWKILFVVFHLRASHFTRGHPWRSWWRESSILSDPAHQGETTRAVGQTPTHFFIRCTNTKTQIHKYTAQKYTNTSEPAYYGETTSCRATPPHLPTSLGRALGSGPGALQEI